jgi:hypothetical protein
MQYVKPGGEGSPKGVASSSLFQLPVLLSFGVADFPLDYEVHPQING